MSLKNSIIVLWVYVMYCIGIWVFFSGYLLKRIVVHKNNTQILHTGYDIECGNYNSLRLIGDKFVTVQNSSFNLQSSNLERFRKSIFIIIDGLRYDFMIHSNSSLERHYSNKMPVFSKIKRDNPEHCLLSQLIADPPTTTLQRLTGITTGSLPTFIDLSLNFASSKVNDDNIIWRLNEMQKNIIFLGDETWESLFPGQFHRSFPFPSFNVKDLDTVDNGVLANIFTEMEKDDWDVIIAHFLGVDHCGHRYGSNHPAMSDKLQQMNAAVSEVISKMSNDTILAVFGDHGMTENGDHGGDSYNEVTTALFLYSPINIIQDHLVDSKREPILQIDLLPTLSLLLGLPIPFSNLGSAIPELFTMQSLSTEKTCFSEKIDPHLGSAIALAENAYQVFHYVNQYAHLSKDLSSVTLKGAEKLLNETSLLWKSIDGDVNHTISILKSLTKGYETYIKLIQKECTRIWAKFDLPLMTCGCVILSISIYLNIVFAYNLTIKIVKLLPIVLCIFVVYCLMCYLTHSFYVVCLVLLLNIYFMFFRKRIQWLLRTIHGLCTFPNFVILCVCLASFSNSFTVNEDIIVLFLLQTVITYKFGAKMIVGVITNWIVGAERNKKVKSLVKKSVWLNTQSVLVCLFIFVRMSVLFWKCREEQSPCENSMFLTSLENVSDLTSSHQVFRLGLSWTAVVVPIVAYIIWIRIVLPEKNYTAAMICINYGLTSAIVCICLNWWLMIIPSQVLDKMLGQNQMIGARCAMVICAVIFLCTWLFPLLPEKPLDCSTNVTFSSSLFLFIFSIMLPLYIVAGDGLATAVLLMSSTSLTLLILDTSHSDSSFDTTVIIWWLLSCHWFYGTGHQTTFSTIHWNSGFSISKDVLSYALTGTLVMMNTFSSQIFHGVALPIILMWSKPPKDPQGPLFRLVLKYILLLALKLLSSVLACFFLRRHLMVWAIFTPKLIFEAAGFLVTILFTFVSYVFMWRVTACFHKQIKENVGQLWLQKDE